VFVEPSGRALYHRIWFRGSECSRVEVTVGLVPGHTGFDKVCFEGATSRCVFIDSSAPTAPTVVHERDDGDGAGFSRIVLTSMANAAEGRVVDTANSAADVRIVATSDRTSVLGPTEAVGWDLAWLIDRARAAGTLYPASSRQASAHYTDLRAPLYASDTLRTEIGVGEPFVAFDLPTLEDGGGPLFDNMLLWARRPDGGRLTACLVGGESDGRRFGRCVRDMNDIVPSLDGAAQVMLSIPRADAVWWSAADILVVGTTPFWDPSLGGRSEEQPVALTVSAQYYGAAGR